MDNEFYSVQGLFQAHIKTNEVNEFANVLGLSLKNLENNPLPRELMDAIGHNTVKFAQGLVPLGQTRRLHDSIDYNITSGGRSLEVYASADNMGYPYGASIEYGFHPRGGDVFVEPRPFLRPALDYATQITKQTMAEATKQMLIYSDEGVAHFGKESLWKLEGLNVGNRMYRGQYVKTNANRQSVQKYLSNQYLHNKYAGTINKKTQEGRRQYHYYSKQGRLFKKGGYKTTVWGNGQRGKYGSD